MGQSRKRRPTGYVCSACSQLALVRCPGISQEMDRRRSQRLIFASQNIGSTMPLAISPQIDVKSRLPHTSCQLWPVNGKGLRMLREHGAQLVREWTDAWLANNHPG